MFHFHPLPRLLWGFLVKKKRFSKSVSFSSTSTPNIGFFGQKKSTFQKVFRFHPLPRLLLVFLVKKKTLFTNVSFSSTSTPIIGFFFFVSNQIASSLRSAANDLSLSNAIGYDLKKDTKVRDLIGHTSLYVKTRFIAQYKV